MMSARKVAAAKAARDLATRAKRREEANEAPVALQSALPLPHLVSQDDVGLLEWASEVVELKAFTAEVIPSEWSRLQVLLDGDPPALKEKSLIKSIRRFKGCVEKKQLDATNRSFCGSSQNAAASFWATPVQFMMKYG